MFGMVLAIGLLVDDAIVVVENVERVMAEEGLPAKEATRKSMDQITGALVGIALVLSAVFLPMAFFGGSTGVIYRQFSITIVSAMSLSLLVALIFTPSLCATLLTKADAVPHARNRFFAAFNRFFKSSNKKYEASVGRITQRPGRYLWIYLAIVVVMGLLFVRIPTSFLPEEDQGLFFAMVNTPTGATSARTEKTLDDMREYFLTQEKDSVEGVFTVAGFSFAGRGQNSGIAFIRLKDWSKRGGGKNKAQAIVGRAMGRFMQFRDAMAFAFAPPAVLELGNASGFDVQLVDRGNVGHEKLAGAMGQLLGMAAQDPKLMAVRPNGLPDEPQYRLHINWERAGALGLSLADVGQVISDAWGSTYINQFVDRGRVKKVIMQAQPDARMLPEDFAKWYVRNGSGHMVSFSAFGSGDWGYGPPKLTRYNGSPSMEVLGQAAPGKSSGDAMNEIAELAKKLPEGIGYEWTGLSYEEQLSGSQSIKLYAVSLLVVFLCLAALYESWSIPLLRHAGGPVGNPGRDRGHLLARLGERRFLPSGFVDHRRTFFQERDLDRGIRQGKCGPRHGSHSRDRARGATTLASDSHDVAGVHVGRAAVVDRERRRRRWTRSHRHRRHRRHVRGDRAGYFLRAGFLRGGPALSESRGAARRSGGGAEGEAMKRFFVVAMMSVALAGCTLAPFYHRPALPVSNAWPGEAGVSASTGTAVADIGWRDFYKDASLQKLIALALDQNRDLRVATLNVQAARARYRIQGADLFPTIDGVGSELKQKLPPNVLLPGSPAITLNQYEVSVGFTSYEIDLFGRIRSLRRSAVETYFSDVETRRSAQITLVSEVAAQYLSWLAHRELLQLTKSTLEGQQASFDLTRQRAEAGVANSLDVSQAQTAVEAARANLALYTRQLQQDEDALTLLVGAPLPADLSAPAFNDESFLVDLSTGLPSDLLERRPDIRAAERQLRSANANIGAARAAFFPRIALTTNIGTESTELSGLFKSGSQAWLFNPSISLPIFTGGRNAANLKLANVEKKIEIANYEKSIQSAFREVADALAGKRTLDDQVAAQTALAAASDQSYKLSDMRFRAGIDNYLTVIVSQRALYAAQQDLVSVQLLKMQNLITLYKALGGGWKERSSQ